MERLEKNINVQQQVTSEVLFTQQSTIWPSKSRVEEQFMIRMCSEKNIKLLKS